MIAVSSWGRLSSEQHTVTAFRDVEEAVRRMRIEAGAEKGLAWGMGRSYGDVPLNPGGTLWAMRSLDRMHDFDEETGRLTVEAGVLLSEIQELFVDRGWLLAVTPGTRWVTVGGAIANDVHGKNHAAYGSFGEHVISLTLLRTDGQVIECGPRQLPDWFSATVGGLGLTGVILKATLQLKKVPGPWLATEDVSFETIAEFDELSDRSDVIFEHTVSWIDCLTGKGRGRGIFSRGNHAPAPEEWKTPGQGLLQVPFPLPFSVINRLSVRAFNSFYFHMKKLAARQGATHYLPFFYPLDGIGEWSRIYGPKGFFQYQSVVPREAGQEATERMLAEIAASREGSFLTVLKTFGGKPSVGMLGFPMAGITLAVDFPNRGADTLALFDRLDAIVREAGGRLYPAKDARMSAQMFQEGYPRLEEFDRYRDRGISSAFSRRVMGW